MMLLRKWINRLLIVAMAVASVDLYFRARGAEDLHSAAIRELARLTGVIAEMKRVKEIRPNAETAGLVKAGARVVSHARATVETKSIGDGRVSHETVPVAPGDGSGALELADDHHRFTVTLPYTLRGGQLSPGRPSWDIRQRFTVEEYQVEGGPGYRGVGLTLIEEDPETHEEIGRYQTSGKVIEAEYAPSARQGLRRFGWTIGPSIVVAANGRVDAGLGLAWGLRW